MALNDEKFEINFNGIQILQNIALDELEIGVIRGAYADILFPEISTVQTRAKKPNF